MEQSSLLWPINSRNRLLLFKDNFIYFRSGTKPPSISWEICMNFRLDISRFCKHEFNKFRCGKTCSAITYSSKIAFLVMLMKVHSSSLLMLLLSCSGKPQRSVTGFRALFKTFVLDCSEQPVVDLRISFKACYDVLLLTKLIFQEGENKWQRGHRKRTSKNFFK